MQLAELKPDEIQTRALACRKISDALAAPTLNALIAAHGEGQAVASAMFVITKGMAAFAPARRLAPEQVAMFAEAVIDDYRYESLEDLNVFMRNCAMSKYDDGEFYGNVDIPRLNKWWRKYLEEKAEAREHQAEREEHLIEQGVRDMTGAIPELGKAVLAFTMEAREKRIAEEKTARLEKLTRNCPRMSDQELRDLWPVYPSSQERAIIQAEAARRGLMGEEMKAAQLAIDLESSKGAPGGSQMTVAA